MDRNINSESGIVSEVGEAIAKLIGISISIGTAFAILVRGWFSTRFKSMEEKSKNHDDRMDSHSQRINRNADKAAGHDVKLGQVDIQMQHIDTSLTSLHDKLDKVIGGN